MQVMMVTDRVFHHKVEQVGWYREGCPSPLCRSEGFFTLRNCKIFEPLMIDKQNRNPPETPYVRL